MATDAIWLRLGCAEDCTFLELRTACRLEEKVLCALGFGVRDTFG